LVVAKDKESARSILNLELKKNGFPELSESDELEIVENNTSHILMDGDE
jgi:hypothetical protein